MSEIQCYIKLYGFDMYLLVPHYKQYVWSNKQGGNYGK